jgi:hypothetical protein
MALNQQPLFADLYAAIGWHPQHRHLLELLANATSASGSLDATAIAAALLQAAGPTAPAPAPGGGDPGGKSGPVDISLLGLMLGALVIGVNGLISLWLRLGLHGKLAVATVRWVGCKAGGQAGVAAISACRPACLHACLPALASLQPSCHLACPSPTCSQVRRPAVSAWLHPGAHLSGQPLVAHPALHPVHAGSGGGGSSLPAAADI